MEGEGHSGKAATVIRNDAVDGWNGSDRNETDCNVRFVWEEL